MNNVRLLTQDVPKKGTRDYAIFFQHDGLNLRLDFEVELDDLQDMTDDDVYDIMLNFLSEDLNNQEWLDEIRERQWLSPSEGVVEKWIERGWTEEDPARFQELAQERFPDDSV